MIILSAHDKGPRDMVVMERHEIEQFDPFVEFSRDHLFNIMMSLNADHDERVAYESEMFEHRMLLLRVANRFTVHYGQSKGYYERLLKFTKQDIELYKSKWRENPSENDYAKELLDQYIEMEKKIKFILKTFSSKVKTLYNIPLAKSYPMESLLTFNHSGFVKCIYHDENTPSMYYNRKKNSVHCFSCGRNADTIDVIMEVQHLSFGDAVRYLCPSG